MNINYNFIENWLRTRNIVLEQSFVESIKELAETYKKKRNRQRGVLRPFGLLEAESILLGKPFL